MSGNYLRLITDPNFIPATPEQIVQLGKLQLVSPIEEPKTGLHMHADVPEVDLNLRAELNP